MKVEEIYTSDSHNIELTVALPIYNNKKIAWLSIESLCNQVDIDFDWELIVYEEIHDESSCPELLFEYIDRLVNVRCKRIILITDDFKVPLTNKWIEIANNADYNSKCYLFHGSDDYSPKNRFKRSYDKIIKENFDWYDQKKVYFYSFISGKIIIYDKNGAPNVNMASKTIYVRNIPKSDIPKGVDSYVYKKIEKNIGKIKRYTEQELFNDAIDTHGLNNISINRENMFYTNPEIFKVTDLKIDDFPISKNIIDRLKDLRGDVKPVQNENILQPKTRIRKRKNEVVKPVSSNLTQFNLSKNNMNKFVSPNNNKGSQSAGKISK